MHVPCLQRALHYMYMYAGNSHVPGREGMLHDCKPNTSEEASVNQSAPEGQPEALQPKEVVLAPQLTSCRRRRAQSFQEALQLQKEVLDSESKVEDCIPCKSRWKLVRPRIRSQQSLQANQATCSSLPKHHSAQEGFQQHPERQDAPRGRNGRSVKVQR